ncbi:MAG: hypothetical protein AAGJ10_18565 [Bacteroidota bacterium]
MIVASWLVAAFGLYAALGLLFAVPFLLKGIGRIDPDAAKGTWGFKLLMIPGVMAFWPLMAKRWLSGTAIPPDERTPHRSAATAAPSTPPS